MGIQGVPIYDTTPKKEIIEILKKNGGNILRASQQLGCHHQTIYNLKCTDPDIDHAITEGRKAFIEAKTNMAEDLLETLIKGWEEDRKTALTAAIYHLNNQGKSHGYAHPMVDNRFAKEMDVFDANIQRAHEDTLE